MRTFWNWRIATFSVVLLWLLSGCGGCDEVGDTELNADAGGADVIDDGDVADVFEGDIDPQEDVGEPDTGEEPCDEEGATRPCGTDVGECEMGEQTCLFGVWQECEGGVQPRPEVCSGLDESCTGEADDGTDEQMCDLESPCVGNPQCVDGECQYEQAIDCSFMDGPCTYGECSPKTGECIQRHIADGTDCNDGDYCTLDGTCQEGACEAEERDCSAEGDQCNEGVCDSELEACVSQPVSDGTSCDDGLYCTVNTTCSEGECTGVERSCSGAADQCNDGVCNEEEETCESVPVADGTECSNGLFCTVNDTCEQGVCTEGEPRSCTAEDGSCRDGECDEENNRCDGEPLPDGTDCDDGLFCTVDMTCSAGECVDPQPRDCSAEGDQCNAGICDEENNTCTSEPVADGTECDDGSFCTVNNTCEAGSCVGEPEDCSHLDDQCNAGLCSESAGGCTTSPTNIGSSCEDDDYCTVGTVCQSDGTCAGDPRDCSGLDTDCQFGVCDSSAEECVAENEPDGTSCEDGQFCTQNEECVDGTCIGDPYECSEYEDECHEAECDEENNTCDITNICDPCEEGNPVADAGEDQQTEPNTVVILDGSDSYDEEGQDLEYEWEFAEQPDGSDAELDNPNSETPSFTADVAGEFEVCLTVTNESNCESSTTDESCVTISVVPDVALHIELTWDPEEPIDLDVHYRQSGSDWFWAPGGAGGPNNPCNHATDQTPYGVWWCMSEPDWGTENAHNPVLDIDSLEGEEPENINQEELFDGEGFRVGVHHWYDYGNGPEEGRVRIYVDGIMVFEESHTTACGEVWEVADIDVSDGGQTVEINSLNKQVVQGTMGPCQ